MKKIILLISLISVLASCGGGGGGGGSAPQTTSATPVMPTPGSTNTGNGNINGTNTGNNNGQAVQPQNPVPAPAVAPQVPTADNRFAKPVDSRETTGQGVKVGVLDSDFLSENAKTKELHAKLVNGGFLEGETFAQVINDEFGSRMTAVDKVLGPDSTLSKSEHGLIVATILAGKNGKV